MTIHALALSPAVLAVATLQARGFSLREIAKQLGKSPNTVKAQVRKAHQQLGVRNRVELMCRLRSAV